MPRSVVCQSEFLGFGAPGHIFMKVHHYKGGIIFTASHVIMCLSKICDQGSKKSEQFRYLFSTYGGLSPPFFFVGNRRFALISYTHSLVFALGMMAIKRPSRAHSCTASMQVTGLLLVFAQYRYLPLFFSSSKYVLYLNVFKGVPIIRKFRNSDVD